MVNHGILFYHMGKGTSPNFSRNMSGVWKIIDFRHLSRRICESSMHKRDTDGDQELIGDRHSIVVDIFICTWTADICVQGSALRCVVVYNRLPITVKLELVN